MIIWWLIFQEVMIHHLLAHLVLPLQAYVQVKSAYSDEDRIEGEDRNLMSKMILQQLTLLMIHLSYLL